MSLLAVDTSEAGLWTQMAIGYGFPKSVSTAGATALREAREVNAVAGLPERAPQGSSLLRGRVPSGHTGMDCMIQIRLIAPLPWKAETSTQCCYVNSFRSWLCSRA